jgi:hypothetical protein
VDKATYDSLAGGEIIHIDEQGREFIFVGTVIVKGRMFAIGIHPAPLTNANGVELDAVYQLVRSYTPIDMPGPVHIGTLPN